MHYCKWCQKKMSGSHRQHRDNPNYKSKMQLKNMKTTFEEFLQDKCDTHTNNSPEGFEKWLEELDGEDYITFADEYGRFIAYETASSIHDKITTITLELHDNK